jgi:hypothetical protein
MARERRNFSGAEKMAILREHLIERVPISEVCEKHGVQQTLITVRRSEGPTMGKCRLGPFWLDCERISSASAGACS